MAEVNHILEQKGGGVVCIKPSATVKEAAGRMNEHQIGALVVLDGWDIVGIFTERDVLRRVVGEGRDPATTAVKDVMTAEVLCCRSDTDLDEARALLKNRRIRHLPVLDPDGRAIGIVSIGDLNAWQLNGQEVAIQNLHEYIYGRV